MQQEAPFVVTASKRGLIKGLGISACFCAVEAVTFVNVSSSPYVFRYAAEAVLAVGLVFFGGGGLYVTYRLLANKPALLIDAQGIIDHSNLIAIGRIEWNEISAVRPTTYMGQEMLSIVPLDFDAVIARQRSPIRRYALRFNQRRGLGITIAESVLPVTVSDLKHEIEQRRPPKSP